MNREIEFRGKDATGKWRYGYLVKTKNNYYIAIPKSSVGVISYVIEDIDTIGQYTGLKDKNGKKIFEGDIVKIPDDYEEYWNAGETHEVYFREGGFRLKPNYNKNDRGYWLEDTEELEVIGTIFDKEVGI